MPTLVLRHLIPACAVLAASVQQAVAQGAPSPQNLPPMYTKIGVSRTHGINRPVLSPDGRWVMYESYEQGRSNIWLMSTATGNASPITTGAHTDDNPRWFPGGNEIAFISDRTKSIMAMRFDNVAGHAVGSPRRITLEPASAFAIAPGGSRIAYVTLPDEKNRVSVRVVPASGGKATTVTQLPPDVDARFPEFSADGTQLYYNQRELPEPGFQAVMRVPVSGGVPEKVYVSSAPGFALPVNGGSNILAANNRADARRVALLTERGETTATFPLITNISPNGFRVGATGNSVLLVAENVAAPIRLVRTDGSSRDVSEGKSYEWPVAWSHDGKRILYSTDSAAYVVANADGTDRHLIRLAPKNVQFSVTRFKPTSFSPDLRYFGFSPDSQNRATALGYYILDTKTNLAREITRRLDPTINILTGSGDWFGINHGEFLYPERNGPRLEVRGATPAGETRLIRAFDVPQAKRFLVAVEGDRTVWQVTAGDSASLFTATDATSEARKILTIRGRFQEYVISPDGKWIASSISVARDGTTKNELAFIPVSASNAESRFIPLGDGGYEIVWTPDRRAVLFLKADNNWTKMSVWRFPLSGNEEARNLTPNETSLFWGYEASPDGRSLLIPAEMNRGSTLYRVDLQQAKATYKEAKEKAQQAAKGNIE